METHIQATYSQGQDVVVDVVLTAHHMGHFVFSACPVTRGEIPTQECFDGNQLKFMKDMLFDANRDKKYPERAYVAPYPSELGGSSTHYAFKMRLPRSLSGDLVLIQW